MSKIRKLDQEEYENFQEIGREIRSLGKLSHNIRKPKKEKKSPHFIFESKIRKVHSEEKIGKFFRKIRKRRNDL